MARILMTATVAVLLLLGGCASLDDGDGDLPPAGPDDPVSSDDDSPTPAPTTSAPPSTPLAADLTVVLDESGEGQTKTWTLTCEPAGGDHPDVDAACAALAAAGLDAFDPTPKDVACTEIYGGPQTATVEGTVDGTSVRASFSRSNGCEISRWDTLAPLLGSIGGLM